MATTPNVVLSGISLVDVPVVMPQPKKEQSAREKEAKKAAKRAVMRERKNMWDAYFRDAKVRQDGRLRTINSLYDAFYCKCRVRPSGAAAVIQAGSSQVLDDPYTIDKSVTVKAETYVEPPEMKALGYTDRTYVPFPTHQFRRKVSAGETAEQFLARLQGAMKRFHTMGYSFLHGACNCQGCCPPRATAYRDYSVPGNDPKHYADTGCIGWDRDNNPFAENYRYREAERARTRYDEDGNALPRRRQPVRWPGAGIGGEMFSDPKARGGAARLVGLEVEHNRDVPQTHMWAQNWSGAQVINDGSCGREAVTPPIGGENVRKCLTELCKALNEGNAGCDARCGLHVHVDARDMRWADMLRFLTVYCRIESLLFLIGGQNRYSKPGTSGNGYCYPVAELYGKALRSTDPKGAILAAACLGDRAAEEGRKLMKDHPPGKKGSGRYKSINIMPWIAGRAYDRKDTTVEFRLHRGSHNAERIITWAHLCQDIVHWCINATNEDVAKLPKSSARALILMSPRNKDWILKRILGWRAATTATKAPIEDDVGNYKPRRIVSMKNGLYTVDPSRCSWRRE